MKIALTADWHLCSRHLNVSQRADDYLSAALSACEEAKKNGCSIILHGGDLFHDNRPTSQNVKHLHVIDDWLKANYMTMYTIDGDHDHAIPSWWDTLLPDRKEGDYGIVGINNEVVKLPCGTRVGGIPPCCNEDLLSAFVRLSGDADIVLWHGAIREFCGYPNPLALSIEDLPVAAFSAILMGDQHKPHQFVTSQGCVVGYPGATELRGRDETVERRSIAVFDTAERPYVMERVFIKHRAGYCYQIMNEEQLTHVLEKLKALPKDPWPMVFVYYDRLVQNVKSRIADALNNPLAIVRAKQAPQGQMPSLFMAAVGFQQLQPVAFVGKFFPVENDLRKLAEDLCDPNVDHKAILDTYVDTRLEAARA